MGISRSTFYDTPSVQASDAIIVAEMKAICDEFEAYGYRRTTDSNHNFRSSLNSRTT
jgi:hypothetical protein